MTHPFLLSTDKLPFSLESISPQDERYSEGNKKKDKKAIKALSKSIDDLQDVFYANGSQRLLIILQGMDTSGKDGTVRKVFQYCTPLGIKTYGFKAPTDAEKTRDYLWRIHEKVPADGEIVVFNRSHYEDVLITRVHGWIDEAECQRRYQQINDFERMLTETGTTILKCMLHISRDEQRQRLQARVDNPDKHWKFSTGDIQERQHWDAYQLAYEQMLNATSTQHAPWFVIPSDNKWHRNRVIAELVQDVLQSMELDYPAPVESFFDLTID